MITGLPTVVSAPRSHSRTLADSVITAAFPIRCSQDVGKLVREGNRGAMLRLGHSRFAALVSHLFTAANLRTGPTKQRPTSRTPRTQFGN
jgi:hypothetical protein